MPMTYEDALLCAEEEARQAALLIAIFNEEGLSDIDALPTDEEFAQ